MKVLNLSNWEHIQAYNHEVWSLSLTKVLATKRLYSVDDLLDVIHEFINREKRVQTKCNYLESEAGEE